MLCHQTPQVLISFSPTTDLIYPEKFLQGVTSPRHEIINLGWTQTELCDFARRLRLPPTKLRCVSEHTTALQARTTTLHAVLESRRWSCHERARVTARLYKPSLARAIAYQVFAADENSLTKSKNQKETKPTTNLNPISPQHQNVFQIY